MSNNLKKQIIYKKIDELTPYENNPRDNDKAVDAVAKSIKEFGFNVPIIIDKDNVVVCGHTRLKASKKLGITDIPCIVVDKLTPAQVRAFRLADNKTAELADWNLDKLTEELKFIDMDMMQFGFDDLESSLERDVMEDEFDENEKLPENPYAKKGDLFILGEHRLLCGDSTKEEDVKKLVDNKVMDMIFTDPPYNVDYEGGTGMKIQNDKQKDTDFFNFLTSAFNNMAVCIKPGGAVYVCHADTEGVNFRTAFKNSGFKLAECLIWVKNSFVLGRQDYNWRHEPILYGWKEGGPHYFVDDRTQDTVWEFNKPRANDLHPTMKPLELVGKAIKNSSKKEENVLDLFGGSGSTLIACEQINRKSFLMELDEKYVDVIVKRYLKFVQTYDDCYIIRNGVKTPISNVPDYKINLDDELLQ